MSPLAIVATIQIGAGVLGCIWCMPTGSGPRPPESWIDDPSNGWRIFNRTLLFLMCNMFSVFTLMALLGVLLNDSEKGTFTGSPAWMLAMAWLVVPLPLAWLYFYVLCGVSRWWHRFLG